MTTMATIRIQPNTRTIAAEDGTTILQAALAAGEPFAHACGGQGRCSTCRVMISKGVDHCAPRTEAENSIGVSLGFPPDIRLACQTVVLGDIAARRLVLDDHDIELTSLVIQNASPERIGVEKHIAILFADIRSFTAFSEALLPYDVIHVLNRYFRLMDEVVTQRGGRIDNIMGDGFLALFEGEDPSSTALSATVAGLEMLHIVDREIRPYLEDLFGVVFDIGVGVHYGLVVAGTLGGKGSRKSTVIGDAVNFASRVEASNKDADTRLLISDDVHQLINEDVVVGKVETMAIRGKAGTHKLYEVLSLRKDVDES